MAHDCDAIFKAFVTRRRHLISVLLRAVIWSSPSGLAFSASVLLRGVVVCFLFFFVLVDLCVEEMKTAEDDEAEENGERDSAEDEKDEEEDEEKEEDEEESEGIDEYEEGKIRAGIGTCRVK
jgi:flagellar biosynthesis/type III secretory pathway M-ring protein FliF/YscJ